MDSEPIIRVAEPVPWNEHIRNVADLLKHLTTLSTASILLLATFLEKIFPQPHWKPLVALSFIGFVACIVGSTVAFIDVVARQPLRTRSDSNARVFDGIFFLSAVGFVVGIGALALFGLINLLWP